MRSFIFLTGLLLCSASKTNEEKKSECLIQGCSYQEGLTQLTCPLGTKQIDELSHSTNWGFKVDECCCDTTEKKKCAAAGCDFKADLTTFSCPKDTEENKGLTHAGKLYDYECCCKRTPIDVNKLAPDCQALEVFGCAPSTSLPCIGSVLTKKNSCVHVAGGKKCCCPSTVKETCSQTVPSPTPDAFKLPDYIVRENLPATCSAAGSSCGKKGVLTCGLDLYSGKKNCVYAQTETCCCGDDVKETCSKAVSQYYHRRIPVENVGADNPLPIAGPTFPKALQGLFWLTDQKMSSSLITFANSPSDSTNRTNLMTDGTKGVVNLQVDGDRTWSFADTLWFKAFPKFDGLESALTYEFTFNNPTNPTFANIKPIGLGGNLVIPQWVSDFDQYLLDGVDEYPGSVVWQRNTTAGFGTIVVGMGTYKMVQVMDGQGKKLPAWEKWQDFMYTETAGDTPGYLWYRTSDRDDPNYGPFPLTTPTTAAAPTAAASTPTTAAAPTDILTTMRWGRRCYRNRNCTSASGTANGRPCIALISLVLLVLCYGV